MRCLWEKTEETLQETHRERQWGFSARFEQSEFFSIVLSKIYILLYSTPSRIRVPHRTAIVMTGIDFSWDGWNLERGANTEQLERLVMPYRHSYVNSFSGWERRKDHLNHALESPSSICWQSIKSEKFDKHQDRKDVTLTSLTVLSNDIKLTQRYAGSRLCREIPCPEQKQPWVMNLTIGLLLFRER